MFDPLRRLAAKFFSAVEKEASALEELHEETEATLDRLESRDPGLKQLLRNAYGYAVFPSVGKATAVIGGAFGKGEVFERGKMVGYAGIAQLTLGVQLGGQTFSEVIAFQDKSALDRFKAGRWAFAANASAVLVKAGAAASSNYERGAAVLVSAEGGMALEAAIGAQKFFYRPAVLGRARQSPAAKKRARAGGGGKSAGSNSHSTGAKKGQKKLRPRPQSTKQTRHGAGAKSAATTRQSTSPKRTSVRSRTRTAATR